MLRLKNGKDEIELKSNLWTKKAISDLNKKNYENFFQRVKLFNQLKIVSVPMVVNNKERILADTENAKLFGELLFRGGHFNGKNLDANFLTEAKSVVYVALETKRLGLMLNKIHCQMLATC